MDRIRNTLAALPSKEFFPVKKRKDKFCGAVIVGASVVLAALIVGAWRLGQAFSDLVAALVVWSRNRWGW